MTPTDLAALHARCFDTPRPWSATEFTDLLAATGVFLETAEHGFAMGRTAGPEAELLTLAVDPTSRRAGTGRALLTAFETTAQRGGAQDALLEVASDNNPALALYNQAGYHQAGQRPAYYQRPDGTRIDALILRKRLPRG